MKHTNTETTNPYHELGDEDDGGTTEVGKALPKLPPRTTGLGVGDDDPRSGLPAGMGATFEDAEVTRARLDTRTGLLTNGLVPLTDENHPRPTSGALRGKRHRDGTVIFDQESCTEVRYECPGCGDVAHSHEDDARRRAQRAKEAARVPAKATNGILKVDGKVGR